MSSTKSPLLIVDLQPSKILLTGLAIAHGSAAVSVLLADLPLWIGATLWLSIILSASLSFVCYGVTRSRWFIRRLQCLVGREWLVVTGDGRQRAVQLAGYYLHWRLLILNFTGAGWFSRSLPLLSDSAEAEQLRRLRVYLTRLSVTESAPESEPG